MIDETAYIAGKFSVCPGGGFPRPASRLGLAREK